MTPLTAALDYHRRGWRTIPIPMGAKAPVIPQWQLLKLEASQLAEYFDGGNVGVALDALVDLDLDCAEALALADLYLPRTAAEFGRPSKPRSHRLYSVDSATFKSFGDPLIDGKNTLLEFRTDSGHQTLFPPSIADNEQREWCSDVIAPRVIEAGALIRAATWLAIGCLVWRYVGEAPARRPGYDLPRLLWEFDQKLGARA
jgi:hypothetical protein